MHQEGQKRQGRFIKRTDPIAGVVSLNDFSFEEICRVPVSTFDNQSGSIIHARYHSAQELTRSIKMHDKFDQSLRDPESAERVLRPQDFTEEWRRTASKAKRKTSKFDDDDDLENALLIAERESEENKQTKTTRRFESSNQGPDSGSNEVVSAEPLEDLKMQGEAGKSPDVIFESALHILAKGEVPKRDDQSPDSRDQDNKLDVPVEDSTFIQMEASKSPDSHENPEVTAMNVYKEKLALKVQHEMYLQEMAEEAKAKGYQDGFAHGEEKGLLQATEHARAVFGKVSDLIKDFESLKTNVLNNAQENFLELSQAIAEALLEREFKLDPKAFHVVIEKAIRENVKNDIFKVHVHPSAFDTLSKMELGELKDKLVKDDSLPAGQFRIESELSVVDVSARKLIQSLLQEMDLDLFEKHVKAS